ncbi:MAG: Na/Pi symporter [Altibacter sp.]|uniref:Na/Pi cotransporter family protein n=1 Tax=Altibacter sp. TaxID=2024823 RepID=UPI001DB3B688|nr:Na/Pi symporter [Altibacter sp.]MBZ0326193.1 Na/Pi symporter [Altibacter sp.]
MLRKLFLLVILILLGVALFLNPNFKTISAGVAILLFGMIMLEDGFKEFTKGPLQKILKNATSRLYKSIPVGAFVTALLQSSSLVSVITISFISAGLISLSGGLGLIFGANIGTTATAWLVAVFGLNIKISALAMPMLIFGIIFSFQKTNSLKGIGNILAGLGFFFLGIHFMKDGFDVFKEYIDLTEYAVSGFLGVIIYCFLGIVITTILQSSSATLALILTALAAGQIEYENALALAIGANIGTTITAILGSLTANVAGKRLAGAHLVFNFATGIVALVFIYPLADLVDYLSILFGIGAKEFILKLALFHTIFNVIGVIIMLPFIKLLEKVLLKIFKERQDRDVDEPKYLNESVLEFPESTISALLKESEYLFQNAIFEIVAHALNIHRSDIISEEKIKKVVKKSKKDMKTNVDELYYRKVKKIYGKIILFASKGQSMLLMTEGQNKLISQIKTANRIMVEIIREIEELGKNVSKYQNSDNVHIQKKYNKFRKKIATVLRLIHLFSKEELRDTYYHKLAGLKEEAKQEIHQNNESIDQLIRENLITIDMGSSLVNDNDHVNSTIKKLITVAELLYGKTDTLLENGVPQKNLETIQ